MARGKDSVRVRIRGVNTVRRRLADGSYSTHHYHRATGRKLAGEPGSAEFLASYTAAERVRLNRIEGTFAELIRAFEESTLYEDLEASTKAEYVRKFKIIDAKWGDVPKEALYDLEFKKDVLDWRDEIGRRAKREADNLLSAMARVLSYACGKAILTHNILADVPRLYHSDRSEKIWLPEHVTAFCRHADADLQRAMTLAMHTGQRQGDLLRLPWIAYDGKRIMLRQRKGKALVSILCTKALRETLDGMERRGPTILTTKTGRAWKKRYFADKWKEASDAAEIGDLHFHDLRGTAVTMMAEAGCTVPEIAAVTGHTLAHAQRILDTYMARTRSLADAAIIKMERRMTRGAKR